jgi:hypothetical protein
MLLADQAEWKAAQAEERAARRAAKALLRNKNVKAPTEPAPDEVEDRNQAALF